jgi:hypothetical protein
MNNRPDWAYKELEELQERARNSRDIKEYYQLSEAADRIYDWIMKREEYMRQTDQLINMYNAKNRYTIIRRKVIFNRDTLTLYVKAKKGIIVVDLKRFKTTFVSLGASII